ncbi:MAG TPA: hypothetical protein VF981_06700 [Gemmatimonadaceae bacterium]
MRRLVILTGVLVAVTATASIPAQTPSAGRRGAAPLGLAMSDGEPISFVLEHSGILDLTDPQRTALMNIRRVLRRVNAPFMERLDSLRELVGISMEPRRLGGEDREKLARLDSLAKPIKDSIRVNNDAANLQARSVLDSAQIVRLDSIIVDERGAADGRGRPPRG